MMLINSLRGDTSPPAIPFPHLGLDVPSTSTHTLNVLSTTETTGPKSLTPSTTLPVSRSSRPRSKSKSVNDLTGLSASTSSLSTTTVHADPSAAAESISSSDDLQCTIAHLRFSSPPPSLDTVRARRHSVKQERRELITMLRDRTASRAADLGIDVTGLRHLQRDSRGQCIFVADRLGRRRTSLGVRPSDLSMEAGRQGQMGDDEVIEEEWDGKVALGRNRARTCAAILGERKVGRGQNDNEGVTGEIAL